MAAEQTGTTYKVVASPWRGRTFAWSLALEKPAGRMVILEVCDLAAFQRVGSRVFVKRLASMPELMGTIIDQRCSGQHAFIATTVPPGQRLSALLPELTPEKRSLVARQLVDAVTRIHAAGITVGVFHPDSIYVDQERVSLVLPGIASFCTAGGVEGKEVVGILGELAAPELSDVEPNAQTDLYALGRLLQQLKPAWDEDLSALLAGMTSNQPEWRQNAFTSLSRSLSGTSKRTTALVTGLSLAAVLLVATGLFVFLRGSGEQTVAEARPPATPPTGNRDTPADTPAGQPVDQPAEPKTPLTERPAPVEKNAPVDVATVELQANPTPLAEHPAKTPTGTMEIRPRSDDTSPAVTAPPVPVHRQDEPKVPEVPQTEPVRVARKQLPEPTPEPELKAQPVRRPILRRPVPEAGDDFERHLAPLKALETAKTEPKPAQDLTQLQWSWAADLLKQAAQPLSSSSSAYSDITYMTSDESTRRIAFQRLGELRHPKVAQGMTRLAQHHSPRARRFLCEALAVQNNPEAATIAVGLLGDEDPYVAAAASYALSQMKSAEVVKFLTERVLPSSAPPASRAAVVDALVDIGDPAAQDALKSVLRDRDGEVRAAAAIALGRFRTRESADDLRALLKDSDARPRAAALLALASLRHEPSLTDAIAALDDRVDFVRRSAVRALTALRHRDAVPALIRRLAGEQVVKGEIARALALTTGQCFGDDAGKWERWWKEAEKEFAVPPIPMGVIALAGLKPPVSCFETPTGSRRIALVLSTLTSAEDQLKVKLEIARMLGTMTAEDRFNLIVCERSVRPWQKVLTPCTPASAAHATRFLDQMKFDYYYGDILNGLLQALKDPSVDTVFLITNYSLSQGSSYEPIGTYINKGVRRVNRDERVTIHCMALNYVSDFLKELAAQNGGQCIDVRRLKP